MIEMTLSSRHRIQNSSPGGLRPSTLPLGHGGSPQYLQYTILIFFFNNTNFHTWMGKKHFCFFQTAETGNRTPNSGVKGSGANQYPRAPECKKTYCGQHIIADLNKIQDGHRRNVLCYCAEDIHMVRKHSFVYLNMYIMLLPYQPVIKFEL